MSRDGTRAPSIRRSEDHSISMRKVKTVISSVLIEVGFLTTMSFQKQVHHKVSCFVGRGLSSSCV